MSYRGAPDVIVVGTGATGLFAALSAADEGASVLEIEKADHLGGTFVISQGTSAGTQTLMQGEAGIYTDNPGVFYMDCMKESRARQVCDPEILMFYCQQSGFAVDWLDKRGAYVPERRKCESTQYGENWSFPRVYRSNAGAMSFLKVILAEHLKRVERGDIRILLSTTVTGLVKEKDRVAGVTAVGKHGASRDYHGGAVIMATGGWSGNLEMMRKYKFPGARAIINVGLADATGEGMEICEKAGARLVNMDQELLPYMGTIRDPDNPTQCIGHVNMNLCGGIWVDLDGKRVASEEGGQYAPPARIAMSKAREMTLFALIDRKIREENPSMFVEWLGHVPSRSWTWFEERAKENRVIFRDDTIEGLAAKMGVDRANLVGTVDRWNRFVSSGKDLDFGRQGLKYKIETPPFYAVETVPSNLLSAGGPATTVSMQVMDATGKIIPGLYAAGEITGYRGFGTGSLNTGCLVFGKQAGVMAAREAALRKLSRRGAPVS